MVNKCFQLKNSEKRFNAVHWTVFLDDFTSFYIPLIIAVLAICLAAAIIIVVCWRFYQRRRSKGSQESLRSVNNNRPLLGEKTFDQRTDLILNSDSGRKITNRDLQEQQRSTASNINRLSNSQGPFLKKSAANIAVTVSDATQKLALTIGGKTFSSDENLLDEDGESSSSLYPGGYSVKQFMFATSQTPSESNHRRSKHIPTPERSKMTPSSPPSSVRTKRSYDRSLSSRINRPNERDLNEEIGTSSRFFTTKYFLRHLGSSWGFLWMQGV